MDNWAKKIFSLLDLTSLNDTDNEKIITELCQAAIGSLGHVAAVCVYPLFVKQAAKLLAGTSVKIATVANFPKAEDKLEVVIQSINASLKLGANEIDVVFPYKNYMAGEKIFSYEFVQACKKTCGQNILKIILETGALIESSFIAEASDIALRAGADFIKTSTGKIAVGATLEATEMMLTTIQRLTPQLNRSLGFKVSGGIRTSEQAAQYIGLAERIMGSAWVTPEHFRIGTRVCIVN